MQGPQGPFESTSDRRAIFWDEMDNKIDGPKFLNDDDLWPTYETELPVDGPRCRTIIFSVERSRNRDMEIRTVEAERKDCKSALRVFVATNKLALLSGDEISGDEKPPLRVTVPLPSAKR